MPSAMIELGTTVTIHFSLHLADGMEVESSFGGEPIQFEIGDGQFLPKLEALLVGKFEGDKLDETLEPQDAFGFRDGSNVHEMPRSNFPDEMPLSPGVIVGFTAPNGDEVPGAVLEVTDESVQVDFNHPLAGQTIVFKAEVLKVG
ncbi:MAG: FKBP-type peptidyl-prolyl cis-trans isomerase [Gammaproteobacteria bacterium]